jgi:hypothetical protein
LRIRIEVGAEVASTRIKKVPETLPREKEKSQMGILLAVMLATHGSGEGAVKA